MAFSTPLICCSSGVMTVSAIVLGEAPGYCPLTTTVGGTISGYSLMGNDGMASKPARAIRIASTDAKMGRSMNTEEMFMRLLSLLGGRGLRVRRDFDVTLHRDLLRRHDDSRMYALCAVHYNDIPGFESIAHYAQTVDDTSQLHTPVFDLVARAE